MTVLYSCIIGQKVIQTTETCSEKKERKKEKKKNSFQSVYYIDITIFLDVDFYVLV